MKKGRGMRPYLRFGGDGGTRTHDLCVANASLYQLSYVPESGGDEGSRTPVRIKSPATFYMLILLEV